MLQWLSADASDALTRASTRRCLPARCVIYSQSDPGTEMFRVVSGSVRLSVVTEDGRDLLFQLFGPGDCFGTSSLVDNEPRPQTAEAFDAVELQVFDRSAIKRLRLDYAELNDALLRLLSRHMRLLSDHFAGACLDQIAFRLAQRLIDMTETFGVQIEEGLAFSIRISQSELASMVGAGRQTINRALHDFQDEGWLVVRSGGIVVTDLAKLRHLAQRGARLHDFGV